MSALTGKVVRGGRVHRQRRHSLFDCETHRKENWLSVLVLETGRCRFVDEIDVRERKTFRQSWIGATFFYEDRPSGLEQREVYVDTIDRMCELRLTAEEEYDVTQVYYEWSRPWMIHELVMKKSAKELDPRHFDPRERKQFDASDQTEWAQWFKNQVSALVPPHLEGQIGAKNIISAPHDVCSDQPW